jgi:hypothetical protein
MSLLIKVGLFLSAYLPLFAILAVKNWYDLLTFALLLGACLYSFVWFLLIWYTQKSTYESWTVIKIEDKSKDSLAYLIPYIISFMTVNVGDVRDMASLGILLIILFAVYINSDLLFVNPLLSFLNFKIYTAEVRKNLVGVESTSNIITLITRNSIKPSDNILVWDMWENVSLEREKDGGDS